MIKELRGVLQRIVHSLDHLAQRLDHQHHPVVRLRSGYQRRLTATEPLDATRGKGSHQTLYFGAAFTVVRNPKDELKTGTLHGMCSQIGIKVSDL